MNATSQSTVRRAVLGQARARYLAADWTIKRSILDGLVADTSYNRKHAIYLLNRHEPTTTKVPVFRRRHYDDDVRDKLVELWCAANEICSKRLIPFLPEFISAMESFNRIYLTVETRSKLLSMSTSTADRILRSERLKRTNGMSTTKRGSLLKSLIPIHIYADWNDLRPGFFEVDLVAHCGERADGVFLNTLVLTDIATGWTECLPLLRRSESDVTAALDQIRPQLPFPVLGIDTDNGSEFINYELLRYCNREHISFTRGRPGEKNDQAHVEEKNGSIVRRLIGHDRYEGVAAFLALGAVYRTLRLYVNFFQPSVKLTGKRRDGVKVTKIYYKAKTPCQRLSLSDKVSEEVKVKLRTRFCSLDPVELLNDIRGCQDRFWTFAWKAACNSIPDATPIAPASSRVAAILNAEQPPTQPRTNLTPEVSTILQPAADRTYRRTKKEHAPHTWRTRVDPVAEIWPEADVRLQINPSLTAKELLDVFRDGHPDIAAGGCLRTFQRRVRDWRRKQLYATAAEYGAPHRGTLSPKAWEDSTIANDA
jgi:hypothetical protein